MINEPQNDLNNVLADVFKSLKRVVSLTEWIDDVLFHHNHAVIGWHLNGAHEPIMNFVSEMESMQIFPET